MKKLLLLVVAVMSFGMAAFAQTITKSFPVTNFQGIIASGVYDIELAKSSVASVIILTDKEIMPYVEVKVVRGNLTLSLDGDKIPHRLRKNMGPIKAKVSMKEELSWLTLSGATKLFTNAQFSPKTFSSQISGASNVTGLNIISEMATISVSGASSFNIKGKVNEANYELSGASKAVIDQDINKLDLENSGATKVEFTGKTNSVSIECSGATYTKMTGESVTMDAEVSGASKLDALEFRVSDMNIEVTGVSSAKLFVEKNIEVDISGGSSVEYKGSPVIKKTDISSISSFKKIN
ncbi:MAG: DUF2807 domain-containing protein [Bacteroidales bacterium]